MITAHLYISSAYWQMIHVNSEREFIEIIVCPPPEPATRWFKRDTIPDDKVYVTRFIFCQPEKIGRDEYNYHYVRGGF